MLLFSGMLCSTEAFADKHEKHHKHHKHHWKESRSPQCGDYYPEREVRVVKVYEERAPRCERHYRPKWCSHREFDRRWVYFPRYNMYWDNYRNVYVYNSRGRWVAEPEPPRVALNVNLSSERFVELGVDLDSRSDAFSFNSRHRIVFKF